MFPPMSAGSDQMVLRPSLCPHHAVIYRSRQRSYRELPLRIAELGGQFREEASQGRSRSHPGRRHIRDAAEKG